MFLQNHKTRFSSFHITGLGQASSMNTQQPSLTKHRDVYAVKSMHVIHSCDCVYSVLRDGLHASHSSSLNIRFVQITDVFFTLSVIYGLKRVQITYKRQLVFWPGMPACTRISFWLRYPCECVCLCSEEVHLKQVQVYFTKSKAG